MDTPEQSTTISNTQSEDFRSTYANNVHFETSVWDLKITFGQLDQKLAPNAVVQHTAVTLPWPQVKLFAYLLQVNIMVHEQLNGRIRVPAGIIPDPEKIKASTQMFTDAEAIQKHAIELYNAFVKENPEAAGESVLKKKKNGKDESR
jgi:hypothetical protein